MADLSLNDESRTKLDGIVQQMHGNNEPDETIQTVVNDFKQKYGKPKLTLKRRNESLSGRGDPNQDFHPPGWLTGVTAAAGAAPLVAGGVEALGVGTAMSAAARAASAGRFALSTGAALGTGYAVDKGAQAIGVPPWIAEILGAGAGVAVGGRLGMSPEAVESLKSGGVVGFLRKIVKGGSTADDAADFYKLVKGEVPKGLDKIKAKTLLSEYKKAYQTGGDDQAAKFIEDVKSGAWKGTPTKLKLEPKAKAVPPPALKYSTSPHNPGAEEPRRAVPPPALKFSTSPFNPENLVEEEAPEAPEASGIAAKPKLSERVKPREATEAQKQYRRYTDLGGEFKPNESRPPSATPAQMYRRYTDIQETAPGSPVAGARAGKPLEHSDPREIGFERVEAQAKAKDAKMAGKFKGMGFSSEDVAKMTESEINEYLKAEGFKPFYGKGMSRSFAAGKADIVKAMKKE